MSSPVTNGSCVMTTSPMNDEEQCLHGAYSPPTSVSSLWPPRLEGPSTVVRVVSAATHMRTQQLSVAAKHTAFQASKRLRAMKVRLDEDLTPQQMKTRRGLSTDFQWLKARGYKPFFRGITLRYKDGALIRKCARGGANKVMAAAAQAAGQQHLHPPGSNRLKSSVFQWPRTLQFFCTSMAFFLVGFLILAVWWLRQPRLLLLILIVWCTPLTMMSPVRLLGSRFDNVNL